jgi:hypothetical protein
MTPNSRINTSISQDGSMVLVIGPREATVHRVSDGSVHWTTELPADMSENGIEVQFRVSDDGNRIVFKWSHNLAVVENNPGQAPVTRRILFRELPSVSRGGFAARDNLLLKLLPDGQTLVGLHRDSATLSTWDVSRDPEEISTDWHKTGRVPRVDLSRFSAVREQATSADGRRVARSTLVSTKKLGGDASGFTPNFVWYGGPVVITEGEQEVARAELPARSMVNSIQFLDSGLLLVAMFAPGDDGGPIAAGGGRWAIYDPAAGGKLAPVAEGTGTCVRIPGTPYLLAGGDFFFGLNPSMPFFPAGHRVLHMATGREVYSRTPAEGEELAIAEMSFHPASGRFVEVRRVRTAGEETCRLFVRVCDVATGNEVWATDLGPQPHHDRAIVSVTTTPDGHRFVLEYGANLSLGGAPRRDNTGSFWAARLGDGGNLRAFRANFPLRRSPVGGAFVRGFSPDGREVILAGDTEVQTWSLDTGELTHRLARHPDMISDVQYSPDGTRLFTTTMNNFGRSLQLHVWDTATDREVFTMPLGTTERGPGPTGAFGISVEGPKVIVHRPGSARVLDGTPVKE